MDPSDTDDEEEVFSGPLTLKEIKRRLLLNYSTVEDALHEDPNRSLKLIETHSTPDIIASCNINVREATQVSSPDINLREATQVSSPNINLREATQVSSPDINVREATQVPNPINVSEATQVSSPKINLREATQVLSPDINVREATQVSSPKINLREATQVLSPDINVREATQVSSPDINVREATQVSNSIDVRAARPFSSSTPAQNLFIDHWELKPDDSFLKLEQMVSEINITPSKINMDQYATIKINSEDPVNEQDGDEGKKQQKIKQEPSTLTVVTMETSSLSLYSTPAKNMFSFKQDVPTTPLSGQTTPLFKTPANPVSQRKLPLPLGKKAFDHIVSPVATYIRKSPTVPLTTNVKPKRLLSGVSSIPKPLKSATKTVIANKENACLPSVNYKSAKETKVIEIPDKTKLPNSQWAKQVASSIPRALVWRHEHREVHGGKKVLSESQENSFDISLHQADLSVCTQHSAVKLPQHKLHK